MKGDRDIEERPVYRKLLSPWSTGLASLMLVVSFFLPESGMGIPLCWFKGLTGMPCPGCGMTRSITHISHLHFFEALIDHPFGFPIYLLAITLVVTMVSARARRGFVRALVRHDTVARRVYWGFVVSFLVFGFGRLAVAVVSPETLAHL